MEKKKELTLTIIGVLTLLVIVIGSSYAYYVSRTNSDGSGSNVDVRTATLGDTTVTTEGSIGFSDTNIYPGHKNISKIKVTATGDKNVLYNLTWTGTNTLNTPLKYYVYKTTTNESPTITCTKKEEGTVRTILYEECVNNNFDNLGSVIKSGEISSNNSVVRLIKDESIQATSSGSTIYYYIVLEYENTESEQNIDMNGTFIGVTNVELIEHKIICNNYNASTALGFLTINDCEPGLRVKIDDKYKEKYAEIDNTSAYYNIVHYPVDENSSSSSSLGDIFDIVDSSGNSLYFDGRFSFRYKLIDSNIFTQSLGDAIWDEENSICTYNGEEVFNIITSDVIENKNDCQKVYDDTNIWGNEYSTGQLVKVGEVVGQDEKGIYAAEDEDGISYYFRGENPNNWVRFGKIPENTPNYYIGYQNEMISTLFAHYNSLEECQNASSYNKNCTFVNSGAGQDMYWRIIRINGDGTIRMIYNGPTTDQKNFTTNMFNFESMTYAGYFDTGLKDNSYIGYMMGTPKSATYEETHANKNDSDAKRLLDTWYEISLKDNYEKYIDINAGFCGDRSLYSGTGIGTATTYYSPYKRTILDNKPTYKCAQSNDLYTVSSSNKGNKALTNPIGMVTIDEAVYAGALRLEALQDYWLNTGQDYLTISPYYSSSSISQIYVLGGNKLFASYMQTNHVNFIRPVINLKSDLTFTGDGTTSNPYQIVS